MKRAPEVPTTQELQTTYPLSEEAKDRIDIARSLYTYTFTHPGELLFAAVGPCSHPGIDDLDVLLEENAQIAKFGQEHDACCLAHRQPVWKPRTDPNADHGVETTDPIGAYRSLNIAAELYGNIAIEIGYEEMLYRYSALLSFGWIGSRNARNVELAKLIATHDPLLPIGVKNDLEGNIAPALDLVNLINGERDATHAPAVLIFRGTNNKSGPDMWERNYIEAFNATNGGLIVDLAHGSEIAHSPTSKPVKSVEGQVSALEHLIELAEYGSYRPIGVMLEASNLPSKTDPVMPLDLALNGVRRLIKTI